MCGFKAEERGGVGEFQTYKIPSMLLRIKATFFLKGAPKEQMKGAPAFGMREMGGGRRESPVMS